MHQDANCYGGRPQPRRLCVRWRPSPLPQKGRGPQFSAHVYCGQTAVWIKMPLGTEVSLGLCNIVFDVDPATPEKRNTDPTQFLAHVYSGQTAGWMKTPLGTEVDLGPGHIVLDGVPTSSSRERGTAAPLFSTHVYCGYGRPSQLLLSSCTNGRPKMVGLGDIRYDGCDSVGMISC